MTRFATFALAALLPAAWLLGGIGTTNGQAQKEGAQGGPKAHAPTKAICIMVPLSNSKVSGKVIFTQKGDAVHISGEISGLKPGLHGFHIHEFGDLSDPKGMSTGGHFNPTGAKHGGPKSEKRHVGDLGNIKANDKGVAVLDITDKMISLHGAHSIIGRALIVHEKEDDEKTDPTGEAGGRIGGGVIGIAKGVGEMKKH